MIVNEVLYILILSFKLYLKMEERNFMLNDDINNGIF